MSPRQVYYKHPGTSDTVHGLCAALYLLATFTSQVPIAEVFFEALVGLGPKGYVEMVIMLGSTASAIPRLREYAYNLSFPDPTSGQSIYYCRRANYRAASSKSEIVDIIIRKDRLQDLISDDDKVEGLAVGLAAYRSASCLVDGKTREVIYR